VTIRHLLAVLSLSATLASAGEIVRLPARFVAGTIPGTIRYQVVIEGSAGGEISGKLGTLTNLEVLAGPLLSQQVTWRGGEPVGVTALTWVLRARRLGAIMVGPTTVRIGDQSVSTNEVHGNAFAGGRVPPAELQPEMLVDLSSRHIMVGEPLVVRFSVVSLGAASPDGWEIEASFPETWSERLPPSDMPSDLIADDGAPRVFLGGWLVIPVQPGRLKIPPALARAVITPGAPESGFLPVRRATSAPVAVEVAPLPPPPAPFFGGVGRLAFSRRVIAGELHAGDIATVELEVKGVGNLPVLDPPPLRAPNGVRTFAAEESHSWRPSPNGLVGWRRWRTPIEVSHPGRFELPAVRLCTFVPGSGYVIESLPALGLVARAALAPHSAAEIPLPTKTRPVAVPPVALIAAAFAAGALLVAVVVAWRTHRSPPSQPAGPSGDPTAELRKLQRAVEEWARSRFSVTIAEGPSSLISAGCPPAKADEAVTLVQTCERLRFSPSLGGPADALADLRMRVARLLGDFHPHADTLAR
jgi:hypothetical protein